MKMKKYGIFKIRLDPFTCCHITTLVRYITAPQKPKDDKFDCDDQTLFARCETAAFGRLMGQVQSNLPEKLKQQRQLASSHSA